MSLRRKELLVSSDTDKEFLKERVNRAKEKYEYYRGRLSDYIKYIPDARTRDCTYKAYIDGLNTQEICCLYYVDESVINRELKAGRQILTALDSWVKDHK